MTVGIKSQVTAQIVDKLRVGGKEKTVVPASLVTALELK